jgi:uncharacterized protein (DUF433 family)
MKDTHLAPAQELLDEYKKLKGDRQKDIVHSDPEIMGGTPVFVGTRVPLQNLIDSLEGGESIEDFLDGFPSVKREQVIAVIEAGKLKMLEAVVNAHPH